MKLKITGKDILGKTDEEVENKLKEVFETDNSDEIVTEIGLKYITKFTLIQNYLDNDKIDGTTAIALMVDFTNLCDEYLDLINRKED